MDTMERRLPRTITKTDEIRELMNWTPDTVPQFFDLKGAPLPVQGRTDTVVAATDRLWAVLKTYASGGENVLHAHPNEDHIFVVLQGKVEFRGPADETKVVGRFGGVLLPRGTYYMFQCVSEEPAVLLRLGAVVDATKEALYRVDPEGRDMDGFSKENKQIEIVLGDKVFA